MAESVGLYGLVLLQVILTVISAQSSDNRKDFEKYKPRNLAVEVVNLTSVQIKWDHPADVNTNRCPVRRYTIRLKTEGAKRSRTWKIDGVRQSVALHDLSAGTTYYVRLLAVACDGKGKPSKWIKVQTSEKKSINAEPRVAGSYSAPETESPGKPTYVRTRTFPDSVIVSWLPPEESPVVRGYMVGYGEGVPDVNWQYVEAARQNVTIKNLKPATQYIVSIRAFNNFGKGSVIYDLIYTRELTATTIGPASSPSDLRAKILSPTTAWLQWTDPSLGRQQQLTDTRYYNVHYQPTSHVGGKTLSVIVKALHVVLYDLMPGSRYEFKVRMVKDSQATPFSDSVFNKTFETAPSSPPRGITIVHANTSGSILISWRPPRLPNGEITGYLVLYSEDANQAAEMWQVQATSGSTTDAIIANLPPNKTYHFKVQARNSNGYSPLSSSAIYYTSSYFPGYPDLSGLSKVVREMTDSYEMENSTDDEISQENTITNAATYGGGISATPTTGTAADTTSDDIVKAGEYDDYDEVDEDELDGAQSAPLVGEDTSLIKEAEDKPEQLLQQSGYSDVKRKREQNLNEGPSQAGQAEPEESAEKIEIAFRALVLHHVSAYVTWPATIGQQCTRDTNTMPVGYTFRYRLENIQAGKVDDYVAVNVTNNFIALNDLSPNSRYRYQIKYWVENNIETPWSKENSLSTESTRN